MRRHQQQPPLRQILLEFNQLTPEEEDLYFEIYCNYCSKLMESAEEDSRHWCAAKQAVLGSRHIQEMPF